MKVVILAGGLGLRMSEETGIQPKPMIEIGGRPILWHIMKIYSHFGFHDFIICTGYKGYVIKEYFANYFLHQSDVTIDLAHNKLEVLNNTAEPWRVTLIDTGQNTMTGGRVKRVQKLIGNEPFLLTYGDGVADIDIHKLIAFHENHGKAITITAVLPEGRFGALSINEDKKVESFLEKPKGDGAWVNGGFFVCEPKIFDYITEGDQTVFEQTPLENLSKDGEMYAYKHQGNWLPMDTLRDKTKLNELIDKGKAPWIKW